MPIHACNAQEKTLASPQTKPAKLVTQSFSSIKKASPVKDVVLSVKIVWIPLRARSALARTQA